MGKSIERWGIKFQNPIIPASGTYGFGYEFTRFYDINILGGIALKGTTKEPRFGNPTPRIAECDMGLLNSVGLQNPGVDRVISEEIPKLRAVYQQPIIANVSGFSIDDFVYTAKKMNACLAVDIIELNISCPNAHGGGMSFGTNPLLVEEVVRAVKAVVNKPLIVKLTPNVESIVEIAKAAQRGGADGLSLINTLLGMRFDLKSAKPILANIKGGLSGPAIKSVALRMVYEVYAATDLPIIGLGGISSAYDVIEMMYAGASLVQVGAANLVDPYACKKIIEDLDEVMQELNINDLNDIIGKGHR